MAGQAAEFLADSVGDMVDDFREKGAVGALKDASVDALDLVLDGVDTVWGWVVGRRDEAIPRICQPVSQIPNSFGGPQGLVTQPSKQSPGFDVLVRQNHRAVLHCPKHQPIQTVWIG